MLALALLIAAFVLFVLAAVPQTRHFMLVPAGLACWVLSQLVVHF